MPDNLIERYSARVQQLRAEGNSDTQIAALLQVSRKSIYRISQSLKGKPYMGDGAAKIDPSVPQESSSREEEGDTLRFRITTATPIRTLEDLLASCEVDMTKWRVKKFASKSWTTAMKVGGGENARSETVQNYSVSADFERLMPKPMQDATDMIFERMKAYAPKYVGLPKIGKRSGETYLAVLSLADHHFAKRCFDGETGGNYDLKIAEGLFKNAVDDLLAELKQRPIDRWLFPLGNDLLNSDNPQGTTTGGTPQDMDGRYSKMIETAEMCVIWAIEKMMEVAPVSALLVQGNHDFNTSYHVARTVQAWFRNCDRVTVDASPNPRKYVHWNRTLLGLTHGDQEKVATLPSIMATERPKEWAESDCREWILGHMHRSRQWVTPSADTFEGTTIRVMRSLTKTDKWHHGKGYIGNEKSRGAEVYFYGSTRGYSGHTVVGPRE